MEDRGAIGKFMFFGRAQGTLICEPSFSTPRDIGKMAIFKGFASEWQISLLGVSHWAPFVSLASPELSSIKLHFYGKLSSIKPE